MSPLKHNMSVLTQIFKLIPRNLIPKLAHKHGVDKESRSFSPAKSQVTCYVYFDNPKAWAVDEYLRPSIIVTDFETDGDKRPANWATKYTVTASVSLAHIIANIRMMTENPGYRGWRHFRKFGYILQFH